MQQILVQKGRTNVISISVGFDVSDDIITSEIRVSPRFESELIAVWDVTFGTDGTDGELVLTLDNSITSNITQRVGYMDLKRISEGEPLPIFTDPPALEVSFVDSVTE
jgi:hypothetical protein